MPGQRVNDEVLARAARNGMEQLSVYFRSPDARPPVVASERLPEPAPAPVPAPVLGPSVAGAPEWRLAASLRCIAGIPW